MVKARKIKSESSEETTTSSSSSEEDSTEYETVSGLSESPSSSSSDVSSTDSQGKDSGQGGGTLSNERNNSQKKKGVRKKRKKKKKSPINVTGILSTRLTTRKIKQTLPFPPLKDLAGKYDPEVNAKVATVYQSIQDLGERSRKYMYTLNEATRRALAESSKKMSMRRVIGAKGDRLEDGLHLGDTRDYEVKSKGSQRKKGNLQVDVTRIYPSLFGLNPMEVLASEDEDNKSARSQSLDRKGRNLPKGILNERGGREITSLEKGIPNKTFLRTLQKKEKSVHKEMELLKLHSGVVQKRTIKSALPFNGSTRMTRLMGSSPEVSGRELTQFLQSTGGVNGGWSKEEHSAFLKVFKSHRNNPVKLISSMTETFSYLKGEDIIAHSDWYTKYEALQKEDKDFVRNWRIAKQKEREMVYQMAKEDKKAAVEAQRRRGAELSLRRDEEKERNRQKLNKWKESKRLSEEKQRQTLEERTDELGGVFPELPSTSGSRSRLSDRPIGIPLEKTFNLDNVKKEMERINELARQLRTIKLSSASGKGSKSIPVSFQEVKGTQGSLGKGLSSSSRDLVGFSGDSFNLPSIRALPKSAVHTTREDGDMGSSSLRRSTTSSMSNLVKGDPLYSKFRERDRRMMEARSRAIQRSMEKNQGRRMPSAPDLHKKILSSKPSTLLQGTKGSKLREEEVASRLRERHSQLLGSTELPKPKGSDRRSKSLPFTRSQERSIVPPPNIYNIPKLGKPTWRSFD